MDTAYKYGFFVADVARLFRVDRDVVKRWCYVFSTYLSANANPPKGHLRKFTLDDIRIFAYVYGFWEEDPDIESIKSGLNSNEHHNNSQINDLLIELTPIFIEPHEGLGDWPPGVVFGGLSFLGDKYVLAKSYKLAGDRLIAAAIENDEGVDLYGPALYNYRHAIELFLKFFIEDHDNIHNLIALFNKFKTIIKNEFNATPPRLA